MAVGRPGGRNVKPRYMSGYDAEEDDISDPHIRDITSDSNVDTDGTPDDRSLKDFEDDRDRERTAIDSANAGLGQEINNVSFAALLQAQDALSRKRKRGSDTAAEQEAKLEAIRARLQEIKSSRKEAMPTERRKATKGDAPPMRVKQPNDSSSAPDTGLRKDTFGENNELDSDSAPSEEGGTLKSRSSKHAPAAQSTKRQVTRKRTVIGVPKKEFRDPRFDALHHSSAHPGNSDKAYSFLRDYQKAEIAELKVAVKQTRNEEDKETLQRKLISMQNRLKSKEAKEREQEVLRRHRKEEMEKIEQGKKPFFLKQKELKERAQAEKLKGMKKKDQEKLMQKRRRREDQKEKKRMPEERRFTG